MLAPILKQPLEKFALGTWQVNVSSDEVTGKGQLHKLEPRAMRLLTVLAQAGGEVVSGDALLTAVWPGLIVTPSSLYDAIAQLRKVPGPDHIGTVARKGYRLVTPVGAVPAVKPPPAAAEVEPARADETEPRLGLLGGRAAVRRARAARVPVVFERESHWRADFGAVTPAGADGGGARNDADFRAAPPATSGIDP